ncbi:esterase/lipase [Cladophialophora yegresii CBS 114405]|uniref:Esterase/lipase n=1 Tax=Cladophialophora yegresii CBS 114405 TaxID=1182544 RepID=W9WIF7_9EURO|nr:esterase/lipase [Cladophialophora yegresii CBS 114405]EXJ64780.1 esterase/lipase [Cladophialophora yegresii CBS 114405]
MIDHVLGRPSSQFRKYQVVAVVSFWSLYLLRGDKHGPPVLRSLSQRVAKRLTPWRSVVLTFLWLYMCRNFGKIVGLESPEPLANLYSRAFFRATWVTTALDAGFWSAMKIRNKPLRDLCSMIFTIYYLFAAEQAEEKVRKVRAVLTVDHLRVAWNKPTTPYLKFFTALMRPRFTKYKPRRIRIPRPKQSHYKEPVVAWMYFDGTLAELEKQENVVLDIPGGGFVAMDPRTSDDKLLAWAGRTGLPILSLDYRKAPEYPYPYALNECFDVYTQIVATRGRCIGMKPDSCPRIVITGDSAGGNLACGTTLMVIQSNQTGASSRGILPSPAGLVLLYPALDFNIGSWMADDQMALIRNPRTAKKYERFIKRKSEDIDRRYTPTTPKPTSDDDDDDPNHDFFAPRGGKSEIQPAGRQNADIEAQKQAVQTSKPQTLRTRLAVSSIISYFGDRILTPEMMRAMIILYVGPYNRPDFTTDHLLCPAVAPEGLLAKFPKTYFLTGERDPLVDDTVIFAGRLRQAKLHLFRDRQEVGLEKSTTEFHEKDHVEVTLIPGISHGFVSFVSIFPEGWTHVFRCGKWIADIFARPPHMFEGPSIEARLRNGSLHHDSSSSLELATTEARHHSRRATGESMDDDAPLVMSSLTQPSKDSTAAGHADGAVKGEHSWQKQHGAKDRDKERPARNKSLVSLGSEEDLLKRRMKGLTVGLLGSQDT